MKRVLLTGASGFIGRHAVAPLLACGYEVHAIGRRPVDGVRFHAVDLLDHAAVDAVVMRVRPTHLLHFAWYAEHGQYWTSPLNLSWVAATVALFESFVRHGGQRAVFAGTCAEYSWAHEHLSEATTPSAPATLYGVCKNAARQVVLKYAEQADVSAAWSRIFFLYGPGEHPQRLIPSILNPLRNGQPATVRSGLHVRDLMHVSDVARAFVELLNASLAGTVNVASGSTVVLGDVARLAGELAGAGSMVQVAGAAGTPGNPLVLTADTAKLAGIGFAPRVSLRQGLRALIDAKEQV